MAGHATFATNQVGDTSLAPPDGDKDIAPVITVGHGIADRQGLDSVIGINESMMGGATALDAKVGLGLMMPFNNRAQVSPKNLFF